MDLDAASRASARVAGSIERLRSRTGSIRRNGSSNSPTMAFTARTLRTEASSTRLRYVAFAHQIGQVLLVEAAGHAHVDAGHDREPCGVLAVLGDTMGNELLVAGVVGDDEAREMPFVAEQIGQQPVVGVRGDTVDRVEGGHDGLRPRVNRGVKGGQIHLPQLLFGHVDGIVVETRFDRTIGGKMLSACEHRLVAA